MFKWAVVFGLIALYGIVGSMDRHAAEAEQADYCSRGYRTYNVDCAIRQK